MSTVKRSRKAAKSLTSLFDKAALHHLSSQPETANERMQRFFTSINPIYNKPDSFPKKAKKRRRTAPIAAFKHDVSKESGVDQFGFYGSDDNNDVSLGLNRSRENVQSPVVGKRSKSVSESLQRQYSESGSKSLAKETPKSHMRALNTQTHRSRVKVATKPPRSPSKQKSASKQRSQPITKTKQILLHPRTTPRHASISRVEDQRSATELSPDRSPKKSKGKPIAAENNVTTELFNCSLKHFNFVRTQVGLLRQPVMFGGTVQHRFETKAKESSETINIPEAVLNKAVRLYNKKLMHFHHEHNKRSEDSLMKAVASLNELNSASDETSSPLYWRRVASDCEFECPDEFPPAFEASKEQFHKFLALKEEIDELQSERRRKTNVLKSLNELAKEVDSLKKADNKFLLEKCHHPTSARLHASKLAQAINNVHCLTNALVGHQTQGESEENGNSAI